MHVAPRETEPVRTTGRNLLKDLAIEYSKRALAKAALSSTSWHNDILVLSESIVVKHAAELTDRRRQLTMTPNHGQDDSRWLQEVECFIDEVIEKSGGHVRCSPDRLRAVRWMIASATAEFASSRAAFRVADEAADAA
jgi:aspartyl/asparaginyl beta-hydroxylase (cupin superfamily)